MSESPERLATGLYIFPDAFSGTPMSNLQSLKAHISPCDVEFSSDGSILSKDLDDILGRHGGRHLTNIYDRSPVVDDWYYSLYSLPNTPSETRTAYQRTSNPVADAIMPQGSSGVEGPVLVVLDGPAEGKWAVRETIDEDKFARTVWWYFKSGNDASQVYGERKFRRFLRTYV